MHRGVEWSVKDNKQPYVSEIVGMPTRITISQSQRCQVGRGAKEFN